MESIKKIFKIGNGPSSSHTIGPRTAAIEFLARTRDAFTYQVTLYGALAATGKGHLTDKAILEVLGSERTEILWKPEENLPFHTNGMKFIAFNSQKEKIDEWIIYSVGGGKLADENTVFSQEHIYPHKNISEILDYIEERGMTFWEYVQEYEDKDIWDYLGNIWEVMRQSVEDGLSEQGVLPGGLCLPRKAMQYHIRALSYKPSLVGRSLVQAYALAVSEHNAGGGKIVTAPTCGSSGVLPAVLYHLNHEDRFSTKQIIWALATAGLFGNVVKENASISGAEVGCQGEVGTACSMAAAAANQIFGGSPQQIEYAAEMALEHHLGLTCDPICGLVQVPCIERNAFAALRALDANLYAMMSDGKHIISFDKVVETMNLTGKDLPSLYKETATGGLAIVHKIRNDKESK
ncbi:MAG: L-serine ammonia-lyase [Bacteroidales bacterium]|jgi:L-serine dehydratase|nr:L-serine ammonia-lyase [Bacteroidales bacterium]